MNNDINLLSNVNDSLEREEKTARILRISSFILLGLIGVLSIILFVLNYELSTASIEAQQKTVLQQLQSFNPQEEKISIIKNRLTGIQDILSQRVDYNRIVSAVLGKMPSGVSVNDITTDGSTLTLSVSADSLVAINSLMDNLTDMAQKKEIINSLTLASLVLNVKEGSYSVSFTADMQ